MRNFKQLFALCLFSLVSIVASAEETIPNNQIWYTTTEGVVLGTREDGFGANIVSNTYEDGKGVITFDADVTSIGEDAFIYNTILESIYLPNTVTTIGDFAFYCCGKLASVNIPNSVVSIGKGAFSPCHRLTSINIPKSVTSIGEDAFCGCDSLTNITVETGNKVYDSRDNCNAIIETANNTLIQGCKNTTIPNTVTSIGASAFRECMTLTSIDIPNSVTSIGDDAFYY
ncbi:MAG: leucine-rich repeat domain-containing protein, partial [Prevotellaceae bacterium]|nr:leucine-rich repeat domain-containing protein [Prevotellaceae bacterium]